MKSRLCKEWIFLPTYLYMTAQDWDVVFPPLLDMEGQMNSWVGVSQTPPLGMGSNSPLWKRFSSGKSIHQGGQGKNPGCFLQTQSILCPLLKDTDGVEAAVICGHLPSGDWCHGGMCGLVGWQAGSRLGRSPRLPPCSALEQDGFAGRKNRQL